MSALEAVIASMQEQPAPDVGGGGPAAPQAKRRKRESCEHCGQVERENHKQEIEVIAEFLPLCDSERQMWLALTGDRDESFNRRTHRDNFLDPRILDSDFLR